MKVGCSASPIRASGAQNCGGGRLRECHRLRRAAEHIAALFFSDTGPSAVLNGVDVCLILPSHSDSALTFHAGRSYYTQLLQGGVKIHERRGTTLHVKTAVVDGVWSCVGSSNLDWRSALDNDEINAVMVGREFATQMLNAYGRDSLESDLIDLKTWERRSIALRMKEWGARLFGRLL